jgi:condensin complex subunit 1
MDDDRTTFELRTALKQFHQNPTLIQCSGADQEFLNAEDNPQSLTNPQINRVLDSILDSLNNGPEAITRSSILDSIQFLLKYDD